MDVLPLAVGTTPLSSDSLVVPHIGASFLVESIDGGFDSGVKLFDRLEGLVGQEVAFEIAPGSLDIVELRCIFGHPFDSEPGAGVESGAARLAGMDRAVVEQQDHWLGRTAGLAHRAGRGAPAGR